MKKSVFYLGLLLIIILSCNKDSIHTSAILSSNAWKVDRISQANQIDFSVATEKYIFKFNSENDTFELSLDVNSCNGSFLIHDKNSIELGLQGCTEMCCDSEYAEKLLTLIPKMTHYFVKGNSLRLLGEGSIDLVEYKD